MSNDYLVSFDPFLYYKNSGEAIPDSSSTVHHPISRSNSVNNVHHLMVEKNPYKFNDAMNGRKKKENKDIDEKKKKKKMEREEPPQGFIHVRARRGQATDSHSLAERVRREKISERMKVLQGLVPGCEKVVGKALMLDEIINYVQSLQNQIEFLSMKLAWVNPMLFDYSVDCDCQVNQREENDIVLMQVGEERQELILNNIVLNNMRLFEQGSMGVGPYQT